MKMCKHNFYVRRAEKLKAKMNDLIFLVIMLVEEQNSLKKVKELIKRKAEKLKQNIDAPSENLQRQKIN